MKIVFTGFICFLKLALLLRVIFASPIDNEECTDSEDSGYAGEHSILTKTSKKAYTETATSIIYIYAPQTSFNSLMGVGYPTTILIASTYIEIITVTPTLMGSESFHTLSGYETATPSQTIANQVSLEMTPISSSCAQSTNNYPSSSRHTKELISSKQLPSVKSNSSVTFHGSTNTASAESIFSSYFDASGTSTHNATFTETPSSIIDKSLARGTSICLSANFSNSATRNVHTLLSISQKRTKSQEDKIESSTKGRLYKTSLDRSFSKSSSVATTSYHYFDSAGQKKYLNVPLYFTLFLIDYISS